MPEITYITFVKLPSDNQWWPVRESQLREDSPAPELKLRSYDIARGIYPNFPLKTVPWRAGYTAPDAGPQGDLEE